MLLSAVCHSRTHLSVFFLFLFFCQARNLESIHCEEGRAKQLIFGSGKAQEHDAEVVGASLN